MTELIVSKRVEWAETDMAGIVHFSEFFRYMESAEHEMFRSVGLSVHQTDTDPPISWPRVSCSFDFLIPLRFEDEFEIHLTLERIGGKSVTFRSYLNHAGKPVAQGRSTSVCCEMRADGMKAIEIPGDIREKLKIYLSSSDTVEA